MTIAQKCRSQSNVLTAYTTSLTPNLQITHLPMLKTCLTRRSYCVHTQPSLIPVHSVKSKLQSMHIQAISMILPLMINHPFPVEMPIEINLKLLQLNTRRSWVVTQSLLNDPNTASFHFLLIQEPYTSPITNLPVAHANWSTILPDHPNCPPAVSPEDKTIKSAIYANKKIPTTALSAVQTNSN